jgi:uncharacterized protein
MQRLRYRTLVVMQPTTFCNIDCKYCYLAERHANSRMSPQVVRAVFDKILASRVVEDPIVFLWHLGEPLAAGRDFFEDAFGYAAAVAERAGREIHHGFQTNATLIDDRWVDLIRRHRVLVGVSIDGPGFIHDRVRVNRSGRGTHAAVMRGVSRLQAAGVGFGVISVLTDFTMDYPNEFYDFFVDHGIYDVGYNIDEVEGVNHSSSFGADISTARYRDFLAKLLQRAEYHHGVVKVREIWTNLAALAFGAPDPANNTNQPFRIVNINHRGDITTFCPELVTSDAAAGQSFVLGNVLKDSIDELSGRPAFLELSRQVKAGVDLCKRTCDYWSFCGGGSPSNKFFEHGRFDVSETRTCRVHKQATVDVLLRHLEDRTQTG